MQMMMKVGVRRQARRRAGRHLPKSLPNLPPCDPETLGFDKETLETHSAANARQIAMGYMPGVAECAVKDNKLTNLIKAPLLEVNLAKQPVLFKMLVELGHGPRRNEDGDLAVRVKEDRHRKPEEVVAALSQPRKPKEVKEVKEEGYPSVGRPRLKVEDEEELVKRLYKVPVKAAVPEKELSKPRRTAAEQRNSNHGELLQSSVPIWSNF
eukprot:g15561.t1